MTATRWTTALLLLVSISCRPSATKPPSPGSASSSATVPAKTETGQVAPSAAAPLPGRKTATAELEAANVMPVSRQALPEDNPDAQGWQIESFSAAAADQLKHLDDLWTDDQATATAGALAAPQFACAALRPSSLVPAYDDGKLTVVRSNAATTTADGDVQSAQPAPSLTSDNPALAGPSRLLAVWRQLTTAVPSAHDWRSKEKIFDVTIDGDTATTKVYYQLYAVSPQGTLQVNATWQCQWTGAQSNRPQLAGIEVTDYEEIVAAGKESGPLFRDFTATVLDGEAFKEQLSWGVDHWLTRIESRHGIDIGGWQGLAIGDVNGDGLDDLYIAQPGGLPNRLYVQQEDGTATETSAEAGVDWLDSCHAALLIDLDNDLDQDLLVAVSSGVLVMSNDGRGHFTLRAAQLMPAAIPYSLAAADYDVDGDLDVYVCCYNPRQGVNRHLLFARPVPYHDAENGGPNVLLRNDSTPARGAWQFSYATYRTGLYENNERFSYAAAWEDYDNDGDLDLYVANDFGRNNLFRNDRGRFHDVAEAAGVEDIGPGMSCCWGDYNNDGQFDLYVSNMFSSAGSRISAQGQFHAEADEATRAKFRRHARGNTLFLNRGDGTFRDVSQDAGVVLGRWAWGSRFGDLNNDGWQDIVVANGFITQADPGDL